MIVGIATLLTFGGLFITVRSCSASDSVQQQVQPAPAKVEKTEAELQAELLDGAAEQLKDLVKAQAQAKTLSEKIKLSQQVNNLQGLIDMLSKKAEAPAEKTEPKPAVSYVQAAKTEFSDLVPVYSGNEVERPSGFGKTLAAGLTQADKERDEVKAVKVAVINRLAEAHTRAVLDQDTLHIPEYTALLNKAPRNEAVLETIQQERLADEQAVEALANPSFWQTVKWWWNS